MSLPLLPHSDYIIVYCSDSFFMIEISICRSNMVSIKRTVSDQTTEGADHNLKRRNWKILLSKVELKTN
jgi:hypothetical protein